MDLFYFILFCHSGFSRSDKSFEEYKTEIINLGKAKQFGEALALLEEAKVKFPEQKQFQVGIYYHIANGYYAEGKLDQARSLLEKVLVDYPTIDKILALYSRTLIKGGEKNKALNILNRYPSNPDTFDQDFKNFSIDIWTAYNLAASYALLNNKDVSFHYLNAVIFGEFWSPEDTFQQIQNDVDFDTLRSDTRYLFLANLIHAATFDDSVKVIESELEQTQRVIGEFYLQKTTVDRTLKMLREALDRVYNIRTVVPELMKIQTALMEYIRLAITRVLKDYELFDSSKMNPNYMERSQDTLEKLRFKIIEKLEKAKASQQSKDRQGDKG